MLFDRKNRNSRRHRCKRIGTAAIHSLVHNSPVLCGTPYPTRHRFKSMAAWVSRPYTSEKVKGWEAHVPKRKSVVFAAESDFNYDNLLNIPVGFSKGVERRHTFHRSVLYRRRNGSSNMTDVADLIKGNHGMLLSLLSMCSHFMLLMRNIGC